VQRSQQALGVLGRSQQVRCFQKTSEFIRGNHGNIFLTLAAHDDNLVIAGYSIEYRRQTLPQVGIRGLGHDFTNVQDSCTCFKACFTILIEMGNARLDRVLDQLRLYEHPLLSFSARPKGEGVEVIIQFKDSSIPVHTYYFDLHPRDLDDPQFEWSFQRQLYDALHDYFVEMFIRTPQDRADRQREDRQKKGL